jgi:hypothetical protein
MRRTPPFEIGAFHLMVMVLPATLVEVMIGAPGSVLGWTVVDATDVGPVPAAFVAVIEKV